MKTDVNKLYQQQVCGREGPCEKVHPETTGLGQCHRERDKMLGFFRYSCPKFKDLSWADETE